VANVGGAHRTDEGHSCLQRFAGNEGNCGNRHRRDLTEARTPSTCAEMLVGGVVP